MSTGLLGNIEENGIDGKHIPEGIQGLREVLSIALQKIPGVGKLL